MPDTPDCARHEAELKVLRDRSHKDANDEMIRSDKLQDGLMDLERGLAGALADIEKITERIPVDLATRFIRFEMKLDHLSVQIASDFVKRTEWEVLRTEHDQMKKLIYSTVGLILMAVVGAVIAMVVKK